ncbi:hypothetical protein JKF63_05530 [Porcisia hertigi]|uniref:Uncharacterized protein n=1 Tax=Porcisia hertigi TaxID=2761500 RepID=A0A836IA89_9TRYP|nr:hypothetical protein JKF63_05530 [Porcisia hertigi]
MRFPSRLHTQSRYKDEGRVNPIKTTVTTRMLLSTASTPKRATHITISALQTCRVSPVCAASDKRTHSQGCKHSAACQRDVDRSLPEPDLWRSRMCAAYLAHVDACNLREAPREDIHTDRIHK